MSCKKLCNNPSDIVDDALEGLSRCNKGIKVVKSHRVIIRSDAEEIIEKGLVTLISGGGVYFDNNLNFVTSCYLKKNL